MFRFKTVQRWILMGIVATGLVGLAGCGSNVRPSVSEVASQGPFDMIVEAFKSGQFVVDGGVLAAPDLESHFAYLKSLGKLPAKVLLEGSNESGVRSVHLREFTQLQAKYGFEAFVSYKGKIEPLREGEG